MRFFDRVMSQRGASSLPRSAFFFSPARYLSRVSGPSVCRIAATNARDFLQRVATSAISDTNASAPSGAPAIVLF